MLTGTSTAALEFKTADSRLRQRTRAKAVELLSQLEGKGAPPPGREQSKDTHEREQKLYLEQLQQQEQEKMSPLRKISSAYLRSPYFQLLVLCTILCNVVTIGIETNLVETLPVYEKLDMVYLGIYTFEFILRYYVDRSLYWSSHYNTFDFLVLIVSYIQWVMTNVLGEGENLTFLRVFRAFRAIRAFRSVAYLKSLQVLVTALLSSMIGSVKDILMLLLIFMYLFGVIGIYLFTSTNGSGDQQDWGNLGSAFFTLFVYTTSDGWTEFQQRLTNSGFVGSEWFTVVYIFISSFVIANMFIGVISNKIGDASAADMEAKKQQKIHERKLKKESFLEKQKADMENLFSSSTKNDFNAMQNILQSMAGQLKHDEFLPMSYLPCNLFWLETFLVSLHYQENAMYSTQQIHFNIANTLVDLKRIREISQGIGEEI